MRKKLSLVCNAAVFLFTVIAWVMMAFETRRSGTFAAAGLRNLKYFTVLSNIFSGGVSLVYALALGRELFGGGRGVSPRLQRLKFMAVDAVAVTFLVVAAFFGPMYGYKSMILGANLFFHLLLPAASMLEYCLLDFEPALPFRSTFPAILPVPVYGLGYLANLLLNGVGTWPNSNDWYGFVHWGFGVGAIIFAAIILSAWLLSLALWGGNRLFARALSRPGTPAEPI